MIQGLTKILKNCGFHKEKFKISPAPSVINSY